MVYLFKNWKALLDVIVVLALVILLFLWNPFSIFGGGIKLRPTANMVTQIRELGQLVTGEYYGEVIASIGEARTNQQEVAQIEEQAAVLYNRLYEAMIYLQDFQNQPKEVKEETYKRLGGLRGRRNTLRNEISRRNILEKLTYHNLLDDFSTEPLYEDLLEFVWTREHNRPWKANSLQKEQALMSIFTHAVDENALSEAQFEEATFSQFYYSKRNAELPRQEAKKRLAVVGRGWVKAGFDFGKLDNTNFYVNEEAGEIHFFGLSATILNADINPWFVPELGIPGFEILDHGGGADFRDAKKVKEYCIGKLVVKAHEAKLLKYAELNGARILKDVFSLLTGKEIKRVFFHNDKIIRLSQEIAEDEHVSYHEAVLMDAQIAQEMHIIDSLRATRQNSYKNTQLAQHREGNIRMVLQMLQQLPFEDIAGKFNIFSKTAYEMAADSLLDDQELAILEKMRRLPFLADQKYEFDTAGLYLDEHLNHSAHYNHVVRYFIEKKVALSSPAGITTADTTTAASLHPVDQDTLPVSVLTLGSKAVEHMSHLLYPFLYDPTAWGEAIARDNLILDSVPLNQLTSLHFNDSTTVVIYDAKPSPHLKRLNVPVQLLMEPLLLELYKPKEPIWVSETLCFIPKGADFKPQPVPDFHPLTTTQSIEMEGFYRALLKKHDSTKNIGPFVQANAWLRKKLEDNTPLSERFSILKSKLSR